MKYLQLFEDFSNDWIVCYHRSNSLEHLEKADFSLEYGNNEDSIFGKALYFASSSNISSQLGKYICKYKIKLINPLNLNDEMSNDEANSLMLRFINMYNLSISYYDRESMGRVETFDFNDSYNNVQYGEFFLELSEILNENPQIYYYDFIKNVLKYYSFYHFSDYGTNYLTEESDYGYCYGLLYDDKDKIRFVDGPF